MRCLQVVSTVRLLELIPAQLGSTMLWQRQVKTRCPPMSLLFDKDHDSCHHAFQNLG